MVYLGLWKSLSKQESPELGFEFRARGDISQTGRQWIPDRWSDETERVLTERFQTMLGILKTFHLKKELFEQCKWRPGLHMLIAGPMVIKSKDFV